jgi:hypothetical protein
VVSRVARQLHETRVVRRAEPGADALSQAAVDDDASGPPVDHPQLRVARLAHRAAEALDRHLEVHDGALAPVRLGDLGGVRDDPLLRVRRHVWAGLMRLPGTQGERRSEEDRLLLVRGEIGGARDRAADDAGELLAVGIDEAGLADALRVQLLQVAELVRDLAQAPALAPHLLLPRPRLGEHVRERRRVGLQEHDGSGAGEVVVQRAAVLVGLGHERALDLGSLVVVVELRQAEGRRDQDHPDDEPGQCQYAH